MNLLRLNEENKIVISPEALLIPEFFTLWKKDTSIKKETVLKELAFVYFLMDYDSSYQAYSPEEREEQLKKDFDIKKISKDVLAASEKYKKLQETPSMRFLDSAIKALESMKSYFNSVDFSEKDGRGICVYKPSEISRCLKDSGGIMESLEKIKEKVKNEVYSKVEIIGGSEVNSFEK